VNDPRRLRSVAAYWERDGLRAALFEALAALDKPLDALGIDDLAPLDRFHGGGRAVTARLARRGDLQGGMRVLEPHFPLMWADDPRTNHLLTPTQMRAVVERAGFAVRAWEDVTAEASGGRAPPHGRSIQSLVMGERLPAIAVNGRRNRDEGRVVVVQAVCERSG
jgi:hypothetical protein